MSENQEMAQAHVKNSCDELVDYKCNKWLTENPPPEDDQSVVEYETSEFTEDTRSEVSDASSCFKIVGNGHQLLDGLGNSIVMTESQAETNLIDCTRVYAEDRIKIYGPVEVKTIETDLASNEEVIYEDDKLFKFDVITTITGKNLKIIKRRRWSIEPPPGNIIRVESPVKFVIITHTASESSLTQAGNVKLVRKAQDFHMTDKNFNDIGYNFLVGCDGMVYEGRGWGVAGNHTRTYDEIGIGISFIGCFTEVIPNEAALYQVKALIEYGVEIGKIDENYVLFGHCQCCPTQSPGRALLNEIRTWGHWKVNKNPLVRNY